MELTVHEVFDPAAGAWQAAAPIPTGRSGIAVVERSGRIYVFGGESARTFDDAERYDPAAGAWLRLPPMPTARHGLGAAVLGDQIHVISGGPSPGFSFGSAHERLGPGG
jgi:N-acetylneuraminic acid mutarotase